MTNQDDQTPTWMPPPGSVYFDYVARSHKRWGQPTLRTRFKQWVQSWRTPR